MMAPVETYGGVLAPAALFVTDRWPVPLCQFTHGTAKRMRLLLLALQEAGLDLHLLMLAPHGAPWSSVAADELRADFQRRWGIRIGQVQAVPAPPPTSREGLWAGYLRPALGVYWRHSFERMAAPPMRAALTAALRDLRPQLVFGHRLEAMALIRKVDLGSVPVVFDLDDIEHKAFARAVAVPPVWRTKKLRLLQVPALRRMERWAVRKARRTLVCSEQDAAELNRAFQSTGVRCVPNALPVPVATPMPAEQTVLFLGAIGYAPNLAAAEFLVHEIWPLVRRHHPRAQLLVAGRNCELISGFMQPPEGVSFLGFVPDLDGLYARTRVVACPILSGGGTRIKIIEAALHGRPVVSTTVGAEGLELRPAQQEIVIVDGGQAFADALGRLLGDLPACHRMGGAARERAVGLYDERQVIQRLAAEVAAVLREAG